MSKDNLEKFIQENRAEFDEFEAPAGLFDKISKDLDKKEADKKEVKTFKINWYWTMSVAASILLTFGLTYKIMSTEVKNDTVLAHQPTEFEQIESSFNYQIQQKMNRLNVVLANHQEEKEELLIDIKEIDSLYNDLKKDLNDQVDNEEVVAAMIQHYKIKLKMLEDLLFYLEQYQPTTKHEEEESYEL